MNFSPHCAHGGPAFLSTSQTGVLGRLERYLLWGAGSTDSTCAEGHSPGPIRDSNYLLFLWTSLKTAGGIFSSCWVLRRA